MGSASGQAVEDLTWSQEPTTGRWYALRLEDYGNFQPIPQRIPYPDANDYCRALTGWLPTTNDKVVADWISQSFGPDSNWQYFWLGMRGVKTTPSGGGVKLTRFWESGGPWIPGSWADTNTWPSTWYWRVQDKLYGTYIEPDSDIVSWPEHNVQEAQWDKVFARYTFASTVCELWTPAHPLTDTDGDGVLDVYEDSNHDGIVDPWETDPLDPNDGASFAMYVRRFGPGDAPFFIIRNGTPNGILYPLFSLTGPGPHDVGLGTMMDLSPPIGQLPSIVLDAGGRGEGARGALPHSVPFGLPVWIQGLELSFNSNGFEFNVTNSLFIQVGAI